MAREWNEDVPAQVVLTKLDYEKHAEKMCCRTQLDCLAQEFDWTPCSWTSFVEFLRRGDGMPVRHNNVERTLQWEFVVHLQRATLESITLELQQVPGSRS